MLLKVSKYNLKGWEYIIHEIVNLPHIFVEIQCKVISEYQTCVSYVKSNNHQCF